jgi:LDH2 family malate/lactate/ureidoglycolate dehydrogenase
LGSPFKLVADTVRASGPRWTATLVADRVLPLGVLRLWPEWRVEPDALAGQLRAVLRAWGMGDPQVETTVRHVLYADLHGVDSHGCAMLLHYQRGVAAGTFDAAAVPEVVRETDTTALVDGGGGLGHVAADTAMRLAVDKCRSAGLAAVAVRNSGHFGAAGSYASLATDAGLIGMVTTTTDLPAVVPTHGAEPMLGTNAIAFAAPARRNRPFLLDIATSTASLGRAVTAWRRGRRIPPGWAMDERGRAVTNGRVAAEGRRLTPLGSTHALGSHKGYGLAAAAAVLSSVLPGSERVGHFCLALDPARFRELAAFEGDLDVLLDSLRASAPLDPRRPVRVAGDPERAAHAERTRTGIPLPRAVVEDIRAVTRSAGVPFTLEPRP